MPAARASRAVNLPLLRSLPNDITCVLRLSRSDLGVCLRRRRSSLASLMSSRRRPKSLAHLSRLRVVGTRLPRCRFSRVSLVATTALLAFPVCRVPISACPPDAVGLRLGRSLSRRRPKPLARLSRSRVIGARNPRRRASLTSLVATATLLAFRVSSVSISACAAGAVGLRSHRSSSRRRPISRAPLSRSRVVGTCQPRRRPYPASLVATAASLAFRISRVLIPACA